MELVLQTFINAIQLSIFYALVAIGLSLVFGVAGIANLAHGELYMLGAYVVWLFYGLRGVNYIAAVLLAMLLVGGLGIIIERGIFKPLRGNVLGVAIISVGLLFILQVLVGQIWGLGYPKRVDAPIMGALNIHGVSIGWQRVIIIFASILLLGTLWVFLQRTKLGRAIRASAQDSEAASLQGISINRSATLAMGIGSALTGAAGALMAPAFAVHPYMGHVVLLIALIVVIVGGAGNLKGTVLAAILFGFLYTIITTFLDAVIANIASVLFMVLLLAIKPGGLAEHGT
ncbi:MAG: branched-chain amino acid ABC transporter permease [Desulfobacteraceae bacterium]|nr:branched-chain amino acid ABC transporter permease [Desulfobacteraceae bacterium]